MLSARFIAHKKKGGVSPLVESLGVQKQVKGGSERGNGSLTIRFASTSTDNRPKSGRGGLATCPADLLGAFQTGARKSADSALKG